MKSKITDKFQITIPKKVREILKLSRNDYLEWEFEKGYVIVKPVKDSFLNYKGIVKTGKGDIRKDIKLARLRQAKKTNETLSH